MNPSIKNKVLSIKGKPLILYTLYSIPPAKRGFALLIAVIFMSVMLAFGLALGSISYKQQVLASDAIRSQYAFYSADAGLECALYADQQQNLFAYPPSAPSSAPAMTCDNSAPVSATFSYLPSQMIVSNRVSLDSNKRCADITVYKPNGAGTTYIFSQGYDVSCSTVANPNGARLVSRGLSARYTSSAPIIQTGQVAYTSPGTYTWVAPVGVTLVSVVTVGPGGSGQSGGGQTSSGGGGGGLSYGNNISVIPGNSYTIVVGIPSVSRSSFNGASFLFANNGGTGNNAGFGGAGGVGGTAGGSAAAASFRGGAGGGTNGSFGGGGGGAAGYTSNGGDGQFLSSGLGGGAGGGGTPLLGGGAGASGGGANNATWGGAGSPYGGGGGGGSGSNGSGNGASGGVRIIWPGTTRFFPSTNTTDM